MTDKRRRIAELAAETARGIVSGPERYMDFLTAAARNFKYGFRDQLLIYAQRPEAAACASFDFWRRYGRWVRLGARGIALLEDRAPPYRLRYVFDQADTGGERAVDLWQLAPEDRDAAAAQLQHRFSLSVRENLAGTLRAAAKYLTDSCLPAYQPGRQRRISHSGGAQRGLYGRGPLRPGRAGTASGAGGHGPGQVRAAAQDVPADGEKSGLHSREPWTAISWRPTGRRRNRWRP